MWTICVHIRKNQQDKYGSERVEFPIADRKLAEFIKRMGHEPDDFCFDVTDIVPTDLECICGQSVDLNEINDLAKRMCNTEGINIFTYYAVLEAYEPKTVAGAENIWLNIGSYVLIKYGKNLSEMGHDYLKACKGSVDPDDDTHKMGEKLMNEGKGIQTAYGYVFRKDCIIGSENPDRTDDDTIEE